MFDPIGTFSKQFTPVDGGYLYYPSRKSGGKLVTADEFDLLIADWEHVAGTRGSWKLAGITTLAIMLWVLVSLALALPDWADGIIIVGSVSVISAWLLWASFAPRRLVKDRPAIAPPKPAPQARREARAMLNWPFVTFVLLMSGAIFFGALSSPDRTMAWWAWIIGSGAMFGAYLWIGLQKFRDRQS